MKELNDIPALLRRGWWAALLLVALGAVSGPVCGGMLNLGSGHDVSTLAAMKAWLSGNYLKLLLYGPLLFAADVYLKLFCFGGLLRAAGGEPSPRACLEGANRAFLRGLGAQAMQMILVAAPFLALLLLALLSGRLDSSFLKMFTSLLLIAGLAFSLWLGVRLSLWLPAMLGEELGAVDSLRRSSGLAAGNFWLLLLALFAPYSVAALLLQLKAVPGAAVTGQGLQLLLEGTVPALAVLLYGRLKAGQASRAAVPAPEAVTP